MIENKALCRIVAATFKGGADLILEALRPTGVSGGHLAAARSIILQDKKGFFGIGARTVVVDEPVDFLTFLVAPKQEPSALKAIVRACKLTLPGRGSVFSENVTLVKAHHLCLDSPVDSPLPPGTSPPSPELMGICCIVQRGQGDDVARLALDTGTCVPVITFGTGTGFRDKLGLLRITIPAEKEIITLAAAAHDAETVMDLMIEAGRLDQPGKGFIYLFPLHWAVVNTKFWRGGRKHVASIEQIIAAIDEIKGGTDWRSRPALSSAGEKMRYNYLSGLADLTLVCNEGRSEGLIKAAMAAGAPGATTSKFKHVSLQDSDSGRILPAREMSCMVVSEHLVPAIADALEQAGAFEDAAHGLLYSRPVPKACTYL